MHILTTIHILLYTTVVVSQQYWLWLWIILHVIMGSNTRVRPHLVHSLWLYSTQVSQRKPFVSDTLMQLDKLWTGCTKIEKGDCLIVMGDFNCEIQRNIQDVSGPWFMNKRTDNGHSNMSCRPTTYSWWTSYFDQKIDHVHEEKNEYVTLATYLRKNKLLRPKNMITFWTGGKSMWRDHNRSAIWTSSLYHFGKTFEHCLLQLKWTWWVKVEERPPMKDYGVQVPRTTSRKKSSRQSRGGCGTWPRVSPRGGPRYKEGCVDKKESIW